MDCLVLTLFIMVNFIAFLRAAKVGWQQLALISAVILTCVGASVWAHQGGYLFGEADWFLIDHNTPERSLWSKILCPHRHDAEQYLARETTHVVEHVDATFIHRSVMAGSPHFLSVCTYLFLAGISGLFWLLCVRHGMRIILATLLVCLFWTAPPIFMAGVYVRPGHAHAAFWAVCLCLFLYHRPSLHVNVFWIFTFLLSLAMVWADRQGLFMACVIILTVAALRDRDWLAIASASVAAISIHTTYYLTVGPALIHKYTPFTVGMGYQQNVVATLSRTLLDNIYGGATVMLENLRLLCGNLSPGLTIGLIALLAMAYKSRWWLPLLWTSLIASMYALIMFHQTALLWPDVISSSYYNIFGVSMLLLVIGYALLDRKEKWLPWVVACMVLANVMALPSHIRTLNTGHMSGFIAGAKPLLNALEQIVKLPQGTNAVRYNVMESMHYTGFEWVMKNPLSYGGRLGAQEFVESSQYVNWLLSNKGYSFQQKSH